MSSHVRGHVVQVLTVVQHAVTQANAAAAGRSPTARSVCGLRVIIDRAHRPFNAAARAGTTPCPDCVRLTSAPR